MRRRQAAPERMRELAAKLNHPLLASNCYRIDTGELAYPAFTVIERAGVRVGIIGIAATIIDKTMPAHFSTGLRFTLGNEELPGHIRRLRNRERVDLVVVLSHRCFFPKAVKIWNQCQNMRERMELAMAQAEDRGHRLDRPRAEGLLADGFRIGRALRADHLGFAHADRGGFLGDRLGEHLGAVVPVHVDALPALKVGGPASAGVYIDPKDPKLGVPLLYATNGQTGLDVYDMSQPETPEKVGSWTGTGLADVEVHATKSGRTVFAASEYWFDSSTPGSGGRQGRVPES